MTSKQCKAESFAAANRLTAEIIAAGPERYPGVMQEWAAMVLAKAAEGTGPAIGEAA